MSHLQIVFLTLATLILFLALVRTMTIFIHELGHYLAGTFLMKGLFEIYIGSYGDDKKSLTLKIGNLKIYFKYNPLLWDHGLCTVRSFESSFIKNLIFILAGPLASLTLAGSCLSALIYWDTIMIIKACIAIIFFSFSFDFLVNIIPSGRPIKMAHGGYSFNDGKSLVNLFSRKKINEKIIQLQTLYLNKKYEQAIALYENTVNHKQDPDLLRIGIVLFISVENYAGAIELSKELEEIADFKSDDFGNLALVHTYIGEYEKSNDLYSKSLQLNPENHYTLNNRGYGLNLQEKFQEALVDFDLAIKIKPDFAYSYNNRGLSKLKLGRLEEGLEDIRKSIELDPDNSYAYKHLGIYYLEKNEKDKAKELFYKAKELDPATPGIDELISGVK